MDEISTLNNNEKLLGGTSDQLVDAANTLVDIIETFEEGDTPQSRVAIKAMEKVNNDLLCANREIQKVLFAPKRDERNEYLDNLRGYFNEETGTWYEQICANFHQLTGFSSNKWDALTWTVHLSLGHSTRDYLVHTNRICKIGSSYVLPSDFSEKTALVFNENVERIKELEKNNFEELA